MQQHLAAFHMAQKARAKPCPFRRPFDQAWNIGQDETRIGTQDYDTQIRVQRGKGISSHLRISRRHRRQKSRLAGIRQTHQTSVGDQLKSKPNKLLFAFKAAIGAVGCLIDRAFEMQIAPTAIATLSQHDTVSNLGQIGD